MGGRPSSSGLAHYAARSEDPINLNRALDIGLSIAAGAIVALTIALALLVITADDESVFDDPDQFPSVLEEGSVGW